jgi:hypothetical protein
MRLIFLLLISLTAILSSCNSEKKEKQNKKLILEKSQFFTNKKWILRYYSFYKKTDTKEYTVVYKKKLDNNKFIIQFNLDLNYKINDKLIGKWNSQKRRLQLIQRNHFSEKIKDIPFDYNGIYIMDFGFKNRLRLIHYVLDKKNEISSYFAYDLHEEVTDSVKDIDIEL